MLLKLRPATIDDAQQVFDWRNQPWIVSLSSSQIRVTWEEHADWFRCVLTSSQHLLLIIEPEPGVRAGIVRIDQMDEHQGRLTIYLMREFTGRGIGVQAIVDACSRGFAQWPICTIHAHIRNDNYPSLSAFTKVGFVHVEPSPNCPKEHSEMVLHRPEDLLSGTAVSRNTHVDKLISQEHTRRIRKHYLPLLQHHGPMFRAVDWGSRQGQTNRFRILLEVGEFLDASILDIGCGVGHLVEHLSTIGFQGKYLGIDALPEMVASARVCYPAWQFQEGNILDLNTSWNADYVISSGLFTFGDSKLMQKTIQAMFDICNKAVAFNSLSYWAKKKEPGEFYADPLGTVQFCRTLTPWVVLRHDYLPHDFSIYMYRESHYA